MWTQEQKKAFALEHLRGYYHNPETCGYDAESTSCKYLTETGQKCIFGKFLLKPENFQTCSSSASSILGDYNEADILKPEVVGAFTPVEWRLMQNVHDGIANRFANRASETNLISSVDDLGWFTFEELKTPETVCN